jgi:circadian clock protein KaiB
VDKYVLKLYITGQSARSRQAVINLRRICEEALSGKYELVIIDVLERPYLAEQERILATPTLILESPLPVRRIVGDLSDKSKVLTALNLGNAYIES